VGVNDVVVVLGLNAVGLVEEWMSLDVEKRRGVGKVE
jgi:hypothetical protein